jgi:hypothetical protein
MIALGLLAVSMVAAQAPSARGVGHPRLADALLVDAAGPVAGTDPAEARYRPAELDPAAAFSIETAADGTRFLLVRYRAEGGEGIRLLLKRFSLPDGARVFIYDRQGRGEAVVHGPFTRLGPNGDGEFWTPPLSGPEAVLELQFGWPKSRFWTPNVSRISRPPSRKHGSTGCARWRSARSKRRGCAVPSSGAWCWSTRL